MRGEAAGDVLKTCGLGVGWDWVGRELIDDLSLGSMLLCGPAKTQEWADRRGNKRAGMTIGSQRTGPKAGRDVDNIKARRRVRNVREAAGGRRTGTPKDPRLWRLSEVHNAS